jgi:DNA-binding CsgD family transcriptional regulator
MAPPGRFLIDASVRSPLHGAVAVTSHTLHPAVQQLARCRSVADVTGVAIDGVRAVFGCHVGAVVFLDDAMRSRQQAVLGVRDADLDEYERDWRSGDLVLAAALERAAPVHNWEIYRPDAHPPGYRNFCRRFDTCHYLVAPLFGSRGSLVGFVNLCRPARQPPFWGRDIRLATTFAGFLSATLARVTAEGSRTMESAVVDGLTPREWQIARLAASGQNNLAIALELGIARETVKQTLRRVFRKLGVNGRTQMAAKLASRGVL